MSHHRILIVVAATLSATLWAYACGDGATEPPTPTPDPPRPVANPERAVLVTLYEATDGPSWVDAENWLTDAPLGGLVRGGHGYLRSSRPA